MFIRLECCCLFKNKDYSCIEPSCLSSTSPRRTTQSKQWCLDTQLNSHTASFPRAHIYLLQGCLKKDEFQYQLLHLAWNFFFSFKIIVLVCSGCHIKIPFTEWFIQHNFISHSFGGWGSPRSMCQLIWLLVRALFLVCKLTC